MLMTMRTWIRTVMFTLCFLLIGSQGVLAEQTADEKPLTFNFNDVDVRTVIRSIAKVTGRNFVIDPKVKGKITIISSQPMTDKDMYGAFLSALQVEGYAAIEVDGVTKIIPETEAKSQMSSTYVDKSPGRPGDRNITSIYKLQYIEAEKLVAILRPLVPPQSYIAAHGDSNTLIIADRAGNIERLLKIIRRIDRSGSAELEVIPLEYASASDVVTVIQGLWGDIKTKGPTDSRLKLIADERTNSILLSGEESEMLRAKTLIAHLDAPVELEGSTQVVFLRYAKAKDLVPILQGVEDDAKTKTPGRPVNVKQGEVSIQADENTNALIITAPPAAMKTLQAVIKKLDIQRVQVIIEAIIAEVSMGKGAELGVQWRSTDDFSSDKGVIGGTNFPAAGAGINSLTSDNVSALGGLTGLNIGYIDGTITIPGTDVELLNIGTLITALRTDGDTNILSTPSLVTLDNEEAEIVVGQNVPFATGSYTSTGSGSTPENPFTTYQREDVGIKLKVTPQINEGNTIRLDIEQEVSNLVATSTDAAAAGLQTTATRAIKTSVMVEDGRILVLGGLITDDVQETVQKVPILGSIPLLGWLFRYNKTTHNKQNLMVFLRPTILKDAGRSNRITFDKYDYMRRLQKDYNEKGINMMPSDNGPVLPEYQGDHTEPQEMTDGQ